MLLGWRAETHATRGLFFVRQGRTDYESYEVHPITMAIIEPVPAPHPLFEDTYPMAQGRWFPHEPRLRRLEVAGFEQTPLAFWAFAAAGHEIE